MEETSWRLTTELASTPASGFLAQMPRLEMMKLESFFGTQVMPSQWEFQVGPTEGIDMGDDLWVARSSKDYHKTYGWPGFNHVTLKIILLENHRSIK